MIVLSDIVDSPLAKARHPGSSASIEIAQLLELPVYAFQSSPATDKIREPVLAHIPPQSIETLGVWIGELPTASHYEAIYQQALHKGIRLLNSPTEHQKIQDFDHIYRCLPGLIPASQVITEASQWAAAIAHLGLPVWVRNAAPFDPLSPQVNHLEALQLLITQRFQHPTPFPKRVILQSAIPLRSHQTPTGETYGRIFRIFLYRQTLLTYGYAWAGDHPGRYLSTPEEEALMELVFRAIAQLGVPFVSLDVGQLNHGEWIVLGAGDPQFTGTPEIPWIQFWGSLRDIRKQEINNP